MAVEVAVTQAGRARRLDRTWQLAGVLSTALALAWVAGQHTIPWGGPLVGWALAATGTAIASFACRSAALAATDAVPYRFWTRLAGAAGMMTFGLLATGADRAAGIPFAGPAAGLAYVLGTVAIVAALVTLRASPHSRHDLRTFLLDTGTVMVAGCLIAWHLAVSSGALDSGRANALSIAGLAAFGFVGLLTVVRVRLAWSGPVDHLALGLLSLGVLTGTVVSVLALGGAPGTQWLNHPGVDRAHISAPLAALPWVFAAVRQRRAHGQPRRAGRHVARRPFTLLPYVAASAVGALVIAAGPRTPHERIIVHGSIVLVALVLLRQLLSAYDNARLLRQVHDGMLELRHHERRFRSMVQQAADIIVLTDLGGHVTYASPALRQLVGMPDDAEDGDHIARYIHPQDRPVVAHHAARVAAVPAATVTFRTRVRAAGGGWRWLEVISSNLLADPSVRGIVSNARDITEMLRYQEQLAHQATHDELTGLANRAMLLDRARAALTGEADRRASIALIDLDDFKVINDRLGHEVGDALLITAAAMLSDCVGPAATVARLGGDEFGVLLAGTSPEDATAVLDRIMTALETPLVAAGYQLLVQASIGLAHGHPGDQPSELLRRADVAVYAAKEQGKGRHATYDPAMDRRSAQHAQTGAELRRAMDADDQLHLLYQPIVELPTGRVTGVEALVRWQHPERGLVTPAEFIPIAERTGLIVPLGRWVLREACAQAARWAGRPDTAALTVSVNASARQLREPGFPEEVAAALAEADLDPARLTVEVTETAVFDSDAALETLRRIHQLGVRVALDDFGTGHSSLGLLRSCPVDILKVDKSFVDGVLGTAEQAAIAISLVQITTTMRLAAVAEGVETAEQARALYRLGYRHAQGFHFARPLPAAQVTALLSAPADLPAAA